MPSPRVHADLHTHTTCSDGNHSPEALVRQAADVGLHVLAVTDHDTVKGLPSAASEGEVQGIHILPGIELSVTEKGQAIDLLAYGITPSHSALQQHLRSFRDARRDRAWKMIEALRDCGLTIDDDLAAETFDRTRAVGRPHVAAVLVEAGHVETMRQAFEQYLHRDGPGNVDKPTFPAADALDLVHGAGGIGVLAHPGHWMKSQRIRRLVDQGLDGIEVIHPSHDSSLQRYYEHLAHGYGLVMTGGSDYHGRTGTKDDHLGRVGLTSGQWERCRARLA